MKSTIFFPVLLLFAFVPGVTAQEKTAPEQYVIQARPLLQQCEELKDGEEDNIAAARKTLVTADAAEKIRLAKELGKSCHKKSADALVLLLQDSDPLVRVAAIEALGTLGDAETIDSLIEIANDPDWRVRFALGPVLCAFQKQKSSYAALNYIVVISPTGALTESDVRARGITALAVNQLRDVSFSRKTIYYLFSLQDHPDEMVRKMAQETLIALKDTKNGPHELVGLLKQAINPSYRRNCAYWLGQLKIEKGRDILLEVAQNDPDKEVKQTAAEALKLLGPGERTSASGVTTAISKTKKYATTTKSGKQPKAASKTKSKPPNNR
jgi:HEAT repeat protein